jgi:histidinol dehydrogenase
MIKIRRIRYDQTDVAAALSALRRQLSQQAEVVSERSRRLTETVFGQALTPAQVVERICTDVQRRGLEAVLYYTERLDRVRLTPQTLRVSEEELAQAHARAAPAFLAAVRRVRQQVLTFQSGLLHRDALLSVAGQWELRLRYRPVRRVGICVPGGAAAYPSTLLMTVCPAQAAGVPEIAVVLPPTPNGAYHPDQLAVCQELGVREVYRLGGAQAVAALAYGVEGLPAVDLIVGPGNLFVTLAKRFVYGQVGIDCLAGPSEIVVVADASVPPAYVAADLIAQAEHDPGISILITWEEAVLEQVAEELTRQLPALPRAEAARTSLENFGALVLARHVQEAIQLVNQLAPEHVHLALENAAAWAEQVLHAGAIFVGPDAPVALGDYAAGPSHVLPTGGTARFASGLSANDFLRRTSILSFTRQGLASLAEPVRLLAYKEGLTAHAASVDLRLEPAAERRATPAGAAASRRR